MIKRSDNRCRNGPHYRENFCSLSEQRVISFQSLTDERCVAGTSKLTLSELYESNFDFVRFELKVFQAEVQNCITCNQPILLEKVTFQYFFFSRGRVTQKLNVVSQAWLLVPCTFAVDFIMVYKQT